MGKAENYVEGYLVDRVKKLGGLCFKFTSGVTGVPDRIVILAGRIVFVETKSSRGTATRLQLIRHDEMRDRGADVRIISTRELVDELLIELIPSPIPIPLERKDAA